MPTDAERMADDFLAAYADGPEAVTRAFEANLAKWVEIVHSPVEQGADLQYSGFQIPRTCSASEPGRARQPTPATILPA
jgi:hypothetical protein